MLIIAIPNVSEQLKNQIKSLCILGEKAQMKPIKGNYTEQHHILLSEYFFGFIKNHIFFVSQKIDISQKGKVI